MRLTRLRLVNFRQHADNTLLFDSGLTGIIGPNGSGKTTILEAIKWALYGGDATRGTVDSIRFARASARAPVRIELDFDLAGHRYHLMRALTTAELFVDGGEQPIAVGSSAVTDVVRRKLGMSLDEFDNTYFTAQKELAVMATLSAPARAQFLSRVLGYEKLRAAQDLCDERRKALRSESNGLRSGMPDPAVLTRELADAESRLHDARARAAAAEVERARAQQELDVLTPRWVDMQRARDEQQGLLHDLQLLETALQGHTYSRQRVEEDLARVAAAREQLEPLADRLVSFQQVSDELVRQRDLAIADGRRQARQDEALSLAGELQRLRESRARLEHAPPMVDQLQAELQQKRQRCDELQDRLEMRRTEWVRDRQEAETRRNALRGQYQELREQKDKLTAAGEQGTCPTCSRPLGDHYHSVMEFLETQLDSVNADGLYFKQRLEQLDSMPEDIVALDDERRQAMQEASALDQRLARVLAAVDQLTQLSQDLAEKERRHEALTAELAALPVGYDREQRERLEQQFEELRTLSDQSNRLNTQLEREPSLRREREDVQRAIDDAERRRQALTERLGAIAFSADEHAQLRDLHTQADSALRTATMMVTVADADTRSASVDLERVLRAQRDLAALQERLERIEADRRLHDELFRAFTDLRTDLNYRMRPEISELASAFLATLTDARYNELDLDEKYRIAILEDGVPIPVISGGEEDLANLVLRLAISQMIAERSGQPFSLLILDEVFGSLDEVRRQNVIALLRALRDRFDQVIVITHIDDVRDGLDQVFVIGADDTTGASVVTRGDAEMPMGDDLTAGAGAGAGIAL